MTVILELLEVRQAALRHHCRVKQWRLTTDRAIALAEQTSLNPYKAFEAMKDGHAYVLGAPIVVLR
jgi:hypothetical protein